MKPVIILFNYNSGVPLYIQLYENIKNSIAMGERASGEKLPSLRELAEDLEISVTTVSAAYNQLAVEGYIVNRPGSGYYVSDSITGLSAIGYMDELELEEDWEAFDYPYLSDLSCFDFNKWKKCSAEILNDHPGLLLFESDPQGELVLRQEIARYLRTFRGVNASPDEIVISAGTQQTTLHLSRILSKLNISTVSVETPGYLPVQRIFADDGFTINHIPVEADGIAINMLPTNISSAVYVSPSNQFPTGSIMPVGRRYSLIKWAEDNDSYIIEDDYDSELRYFGKPVQALSGLDNYGRVIYLGSFSSTLFPAIKISYMVLPKKLAEIFNTIKMDYSQTCSKAEQLTLALFMEKGYYQTGIKKLRKLYSQKLSLALDALEKGAIQAANTNSGITLILKVKSKRTVDELCDRAKEVGIQVVPVSLITDQDTKALAFYYNQIPLDQIQDKIEELIDKWK
ncbi:MAG: PLP-dependent aminotransferase family protein [Clostridia bacterium]|nr:PLP-dependent aminotransferase family protein [Clostridia bacterium]